MDENSARKVAEASRSFVSATAERLLPVGLKGRNWLQGLGADLENGLPLVSSFFSGTTRKRLMAARGRWPLVAEDVIARQVPRRVDLLQRATRVDFANYLAEDILVKVILR